MLPYMLQIRVHDRQRCATHHRNAARTGYPRTFGTMPPSWSVRYSSRAVWPQISKICTTLRSLRHRWVCLHAQYIRVLTRIRVYVAPYFRECLSAADLNALNIEIIRNTLYKAYLEDFYDFCTSLGSPTSDIMNHILAFEADRRAINITINSFGTELSKERRAKLSPTIGRLFPEGNNNLA